MAAAAAAAAAAREVIESRREEGCRIRFKRFIPDCRFKGCIFIGVRTVEFCGIGIPNLSDQPAVSIETNVVLDKKKLQYRKIILSIGDRVELRPVFTYKCLAKVFICNL